MKHDLIPLKGYLLVLCLFWLLGAVALLIWGYEGSFLILNQLHTPLIDKVMPHFTHLGEGALLPALLGLWLLRRNTSLSLTILVTMMGISLLIAFIKNYLFPDMLRPIAVFQQSDDLIHYIALRKWTLHSFPSGHSAAATAVLMFFAYVTAGSRAWISAGWGILAVLVCYSRLYIGVHFLGDIVMGSLLGGILALAGLRLFYPRARRLLAKADPRFLRVSQASLGVVAMGVIVGSLYFLIKTYYLWS